jgi:hypothetical protein
VASSAAAAPSGSPTLPSDLLSLSEISRATVVSPARGLTGSDVIPWSQAVSVVETASAGYQSATWNVTGGEGLAPPSPLTINVSQDLTPAVGCVQSWVGTPPATLVVPATPTSDPVGESAAYEMTLASPSLPWDTLTYLVINGSVAYGFDDHCPYGEGAIAPSLPGLPVIDSPAAVTRANLAGGTAFLAHNPNTIRLWAATGPQGSYDNSSAWWTLPAEWVVDYIPVGAGAGCFGYYAEIDGTTGAVWFNETLGTNGCAASYPVVFSETGLPSGTAWTVSLSLAGQNTSTGSAIGFSVSNGSFDYSVGVPVGYLPSPANGTVNVTGMGVNVTIAFSAQTTGTIVFQENGLAANTFWQVTLNNVSEQGTGSQIDFAQGPGTFEYFTSAFGSLASYTSMYGFITFSGSGTSTIDVNVSATPTYNVTFTENGLPAGMEWVVLGYGEIFVNPYSNLSTYNLSLPNGTFILNAYSFSASYQYNSIDLLYVSGAGASATFNFTYVPAFTVTFNETGLAPGSAWYVIYGAHWTASTGTSIVFTFANGTNPFQAGGAPGYTPVPATGNLSVAGGPANQTIVFGSSATPGAYGVNFTESGLPSGSSWTVTLGGIPQPSTSTSDEFLEPNGSYAFTVTGPAGYTPVPSGGQVVVQGANVTKAILFAAPGNYTVNFTESGLASGTTWSVTLNGTTHSSSTASILFEETNGSYNFTVGAVPGKTATPQSSTITVDGAAVNETISFTATGSSTLYAVVFTETGLPMGTNWSVTLSGVTHASNTTSISFEETNGSYTYTVPNAAGLTPSPSTGPVQVAGGAVAKTIQFASSSGGGGATFLGLPPAEGYALLAIIILIVLIGIAMLALRSRRRPAATPPPASPTAPPPPS